MGSYAVPEEIRNKKPRGTVVKALHGKYYVYEQKNIKDPETGKWKIKSGKMIGSIAEGIGFIPNSNYVDSTKTTTMDFGEYFLTSQITKEILENLKQCFNVKDAINIYNLALIHFINGFTYIKNIKPIYDLSYLSMKYPTLSLSEYIVSNLLHNLGCHTTQIEDFENLLINKSTKQFAVDGHAIMCTSDNNALAEEGNKKLKFKEDQINLLMAYDINTNAPVLSRFYAGGTMDNVAFSDLFERKNFENTLFIIDKGFNSPKNLKLCSENNNKYIIPLKVNMKSSRAITQNYNFKNRFVYEKGKSNTLIEYKVHKEKDVTVYLFKDVNENALECTNYASKIGTSEKYTQEKYEQLKESFGTIILQTNLVKEAHEIYDLYKRRWLIETFYDYYKNKLDANTLHSQDYYVTQGMSFVLLITSLIHQKFVEKTKRFKKSVTSILLDTRFLKLNYKNGTWALENLSKNHYEIFNQLGISLEEEMKYLNSLKK